MIQAHNCHLPEENQTTYRPHHAAAGVDTGNNPPTTKVVRRDGNFRQQSGGSELTVCLCVCLN